MGFKTNWSFPSFIEGVEVGKRRVDFLIAGKVLLEIKAITELTDTHLAQALNYLECLNLEVGLLINLDRKAWK